MTIRTSLPLLALLACTLPAFAQQPSLGLSALKPQAEATQPAQSAMPRKITLDVVVTPHSGPPVAGLQQGDFTVLDNKSPRPLTSFRAFTTAQEPIQVLLVVDAVNTNFSILSQERLRIEEFLRANGGHLAYPTALAIFTDTGVEIQNSYTTDGTALSADLEHYTIGLRDIRRSSQFEAQDRTQLSLTALGRLSARLAANRGRKIVLWVSPGWPLLSGPGVDLSSKQQGQTFGDLVSFTNQLRQGRITLYSIDPIGAAESIGRTTFFREYLNGVTKPENAELGNLSLQVLALQSGGLALASSNDVAALLKQALADASAYYEISFDPPPADHPNEYHRIEIQLAKPGLTARTEQGYYAQP